MGCINPSHGWTFFFFFSCTLVNYARVPAPSSLCDSLMHYYLPRIERLLDHPLSVPRHLRFALFWSQNAARGPRPPSGIMRFFADYGCDHWRFSCSSHLRCPPFSGPLLSLKWSTPRFSSLFQPFVDLLIDGSAAISSFPNVSVSRLRKWNQPPQNGLFPPLRDQHVSTLVARSTHSLPLFFEAPSRYSSLQEVGPPLLGLSGEVGASPSCQLES